MMHLHLIKQKSAQIEKFREGLKAALSNSGDRASFGKPYLGDVKSKPDIDFLDDYATNQWESILHFLVGTSTKTKLGEGVLMVLSYGGLILKG